MAGRFGQKQIVRHRSHGNCPEVCKGIGRAIDPGKGPTLHDDEIVDALDRTLLPKEYQELVYEGSRPPK